MNAIAKAKPAKVKPRTVVEPQGPVLAAVPGNPVPEGARVGYFTTRDAIRLRYARFPRTGPEHKGTVCLVHGRTEFIEKYFETIADLQRRGFTVATFDWRGQGGSDRLIGNRKFGYIDHFDDYWVDLSSFHAEILLPDCPPPFYLVAHSMGGLVALEAGIRDRLMFDRIFLSAPMLALDGQPLGMGGMARIADALSFVGLGQAPLRRPQDRVPTERSFRNNPLTSDLRRFLVTVKVLEARPDLAITSPAIRWIAAAMHAMERASRDDYPAQLRVPVLMLAAARDRVVSSAAIEHLGVRMRTGRHIVIPAARHELFMESDGIRGQVLAAFDAFVTNQSR